MRHAVAGALPDCRFLLVIAPQLTGAKHGVGCTGQLARAGDTSDLPADTLLLAFVVARQPTVGREPGPDPNTGLSLVSGAQITGASAQTSTDRQLVHPAPSLLYVVSAPPYVVSAPPSFEARLPIAPPELTRVSVVCAIKKRLSG